MTDFSDLPAEVRWRQVLRAASALYYGQPAVLRGVSALSEGELNAVVSAFGKVAARLDELAKGAHDRALRAELNYGAVVVTYHLCDPTSYEE